MRPNTNGFDWASLAACLVLVVLVIIIGLLLQANPV